MISVGVAAVGPAPWALVESLLDLEMPAGEAMRFIRRGPLAVDVARNEVIKAFLAGGDEWLLMLDSDAVVHPGTLRRLLSWGEPVVGALVFSRYGPLMPTVMRGQSGIPGQEEGRMTQLREIREWVARHPELQTSDAVVLEPRPADALTRVDRTGCHCLLLRRDVLAGMEAPWFVGDPDMSHAREDMFFFSRLEGAGQAAFVDRSVMAAHLYGDRPLAALDWLVWDQVSEYGDGEDA